MWHVNKHNGRQAIDMVLMDHTGAKIGATLWQELFPEFEPKFLFVKTTFVKEVERPKIPPNVHVIIEFAYIITGVAPRDTLVDKYPLSVQNIKHGSKLYVNTDIVEIQQFRKSLRVPFYVGGVTNEGSASQSQYSQHSQRNSVEKFLHNAQMVNLGEISRLRQDCYCLTVATVDEVMIDTPWSYDSCPYCTTTFDPLKIGAVCRSCQNQVTHTVPRYKLVVKMEQNREKANFHFWDVTCIKIFGKMADECHQQLIASVDEIKVFPPCVDELLGKTWAVIFKYHFQMRQSSMLDVSKEEHHIHTLTSTLGLQDEPSIGKSPAVGAETSSQDYHLTNLIEVPTTYHRKWAPHYPLYVLFNYNGDKHYIKVRKYYNKCYFADGLKELRRIMGIHEGVMITFAAPEKNWIFHLRFMPPLDIQTCGRPPTISRTHVLQLDALNFVDVTTKYMIVLHIHGRRHLWKLIMHNGLQSIAETWYQYLTENDLHVEDEVAFYYRPNQHVWEFIFKKELTWNEEESI
ncbi:hypothetical protein JHK86_042967 [Glycine max]|nr:hypothetical protein JHK86_042967 [Glycine max]